MITFSIVTPTIQRESLFQCCQSVDRQTYKHWQHIVRMDRDILKIEVVKTIAHEQRLITHCDVEHRNFGNTCRHQAWKQAIGDFVLYLDDDNYFSDERILEDMACELESLDSEIRWALFPIFRHGQHFFYDPPGCCYVDTANMVMRRDVAQWPDRNEYTLDGIFCEELRSKYQYRAFPHFRPIVVMSASNRGE